MTKKLSENEGRNGPLYLTEAFHNAIGRCRHEFDMTYAEVVGCLEVVKYDILEEMADESEDEKAE